MIINMVGGSATTYAFIVVTYPSGSVCTCSNGSITLTATDTSGSFVFPIPSAGTWTVSCTDGTDTDSTTVSITTSGESKTVELWYRAMSEFTYTGAYTLIDDGSNNWRIKLTSSGTINFSNFGTGKGSVDIFAVGGGGGYQQWTDGYGNTYRSGGGGGYTATVSNNLLTKNTNYSVTIGSGGSTLTSQGTAPRGGTSSFASLCSGYGGYGGYGATGNGSVGGSGGSGGYGKKSGGSGVGGTNGGNGDGGAGGSGQGTTTREFGESSGTLYSSGGGTNITSAQTNSGNGGWNSASAQSGIVIIRNSRS